MNNSLHLHFVLTSATFGDDAPFKILPKIELNISKGVIDLLPTDTLFYALLPSSEFVQKKTIEAAMLNEDNAANLVNEVLQKMISCISDYQDKFTKPERKDVQYSNNVCIILPCEISEDDRTDQWRFFYRGWLYEKNLATGNNIREISTHYYLSNPEIASTTPETAEDEYVKTLIIPAENFKIRYDTGIVFSFCVAMKEIFSENA